MTMIVSVDVFLPADSSEMEDVDAIVVNIPDINNEVCTCF